MRYLFIKYSILLFLSIGVGSYFWPPILWALLFFGPLFIIGMLDFIQTKQSVRRNWPIIGNLRYVFEKIRPELQQYFVESDINGVPINREYRSIVYQRAKGQLQTKAFGTKENLYHPDAEWVNHSMVPKTVTLDDVRVDIGGKYCIRPYSASILNISAMSYGSLSGSATEALNIGAYKGNFFHNTGEGGISRFHLKGGDLVWQIGTGYFGCRTEDGRFCEKAFASKAKLPQVKMIEIKLSQGAKPGKGGVLPGAKVTKEISEIRGVPIGKTVISPPGHTAFSNPFELVDFIEKVRSLSGGKPIGVKLCIGNKSEFIAFCKAMVAKDNYPDFITIDGAEGGTGAAPLEFLNSVGTPLNDGLAFAHDCLRGFGIRHHMKIIAAGKAFTSFHILSKIALGADMVNSARGMMLALGCIHALICNTNKCPVGVTSNDPNLEKGLHIPTKAERVARFHADTVHALAELVGSMGFSSPAQLRRKDVLRRMTDNKIKSYEDLYPCIQEGALLTKEGQEGLPHEWIRLIDRSDPSSYSPL